MIEKNIVQELKKRVVSEITDRIQSRWRDCEKKFLDYW